ncbi:MAG: phosphatidylserine decarboxylase [Acidobacteria bacterium]|nr:phosphatidylserine decarboxylase [Acidobacteriota bacterium]
MGGAWLIGLLAGLYVGWWLALPFVALGLFFAFFFRDPERTSPDEAHIVLSPADGQVKFVGDAEPGVAPPGDWQQISIFLSPMDVHVNRIPAAGTVTRVSYTPGKFLPAYRHEAAAVNERSEVWIDRGNGEMVVARQVVGILARRVVCRAKVGERVHAGQRFGIMKFGSRMDVFLPRSATLKATVGEMVRGGETVIAVLD